METTKNKSQFSLCPVLASDRACSENMTDMLPLLGPARYPVYPVSFRIFYNFFHYLVYQKNYITIAGHGLLNAEYRNLRLGTLCGATDCWPAWFQPLSDIALCDEGKVIPVINQVQRQDELGEWRYSSTHS
jgi:hypothetical protein